MFEVYQDRAGGFGWRLKDGNWKIVADSAEAYMSRAGARVAAENVKRLTPAASIKDI